MQDVNKGTCQCGIFIHTGSLTHGVLLCELRDTLDGVQHVCFWFAQSEWACCAVLVCSTPLCYSPPFSPPSSPLSLPSSPPSVSHLWFVSSCPEGVDDIVVLSREKEKERKRGEKSIWFEKSINCWGDQRLLITRGHVCLPHTSVHNQLEDGTHRQREAAQ